jgi:hypothetical protein
LAYLNCGPNADADFQAKWLTWRGVWVVAGGMLTVFLTVVTAYNFTVEADDIGGTACGLDASNGSGNITTNHAMHDAFGMGFGPLYV